jgi:hypothetical protein
MIVTRLIHTNNRRWSTNTEIAAELPMESDPVGKRLNRRVKDRD